MDKNTPTETDILNQKIIQLEATCQKLTAIQESQKNEIEVLNATIVHFENSIFHKIRDAYSKFKFKKQISGGVSAGFSIIRFLKNCFEFIFYVAKNVFKKLFFMVTKKEFHLKGNERYDNWRAVNMPKDHDFPIYQKVIGTFHLNPLVSVLLPISNPRIQYIELTLQSVVDQLYPNWELCISDDGTSDSKVLQIIEKFRLNEPRIKFIQSNANGSFSGNSNAALSIASGEFIAILDQNDYITQDALFQVVNAINDYPATDFVYSDEDVVDHSGNFNYPHFKPAYCPDNLLTRNYIDHFSVIRYALIKKVGGFRSGFEGSHAYDLYLRIAEETSIFYHIPKILYHARIGNFGESQKSLSTRILDAEKRAISETLIKRGEPGDVRDLKSLPGYYAIQYHLKTSVKISIIIPTKNKADILKTCIDSIFSVSTYRNFEVILLDNNSDEASLFRLTDSYTKLYPEQFKYVRCEYPFNYSQLMNDGVRHATGEQILLLNNDTEVITPNWMELMLGQAQRLSIGCVGVKLLFFNDTVQHAGVIMGYGGLAGHSFFKFKRKDDGYQAYLKVNSNYSAVTAACLMVRKSVYLEVDGFDESLAVEYNDVDFCLKVKDKGYHNIFLADVEMYHYESLSRGNPLMNAATMKRHVREVNFIHKRWDKYIQDDPCYSPNLTLESSDFKIKAYKPR